MVVVVMANILLAKHALGAKQIMANNFVTKNGWSFDGGGGGGGGGGGSEESTRIGRNFQNCKELFSNVWKRVVEKADIVSWSRHEGTLHMRLGTTAQATRMQARLNNVEVLKPRGVQLRAQVFCERDWPSGIALQRGAIGAPRYDPYWQKRA